MTALLSAVPILFLVFCTSSFVALSTHLIISILFQTDILQADSLSLSVIMRDRHLTVIVC